MVQMYPRTLLEGSKRLGGSLRVLGVPVEQPRSNLRGAGRQGRFGQEYELIFLPVMRQQSMVVEEKEQRYGDSAVNHPVYRIGN